MRTVVRPALVIAVVLATAIVAPPCHADEETSEAGKLALEGAQALAQHHFQTALQRFRLAEMLSPSPAHALGLARAEAGINHVVAARRVYADILEDVASRDASPEDRGAADDARRELSEVESRVASLTIHVTGPDVAYVVLDGAPLRPSALVGKQPVDPGAHVLRASCRGYRSAEAYFTVLEGADAYVVLAMGKDPDVHGEEVFKVTFPTESAAVPPPPAPGDADHPATTGGPRGELQRHDARRREPALSPYQAGALLSFGLAGVGTAVGVAANVQAWHETRPSTAMAVSTVGFVSALLGGAVGIGLLAFEPSPAHPGAASIAPYVGLGSAGAVGRF
jgi:hypothetical protein